MTRKAGIYAGIAAVIAVGCGGRPTAPTPGLLITAPPPATTAAPGTTPGPTATPTAATGTITVWTIPQGDDEIPIKAYEKAFEKQNPAADVRMVVVPEDGYTPKVQTALQAGNPPDVALLEPDLISTAKAGRWVDLAPFFRAWGVDPGDFNAGGLSRATIENDQSKGIFGVGDFLAATFSSTTGSSSRLPEFPRRRSIGLCPIRSTTRYVARSAVQGRIQRRSRTAVPSPTSATSSHRCSGKAAARPSAT